MGRKRRDKCKCGKILLWSRDIANTKNNRVICSQCGTVYRANFDTIMVYWLEEKVAIPEPPEPYKTKVRK